MFFPAASAFLPVHTRPVSGSSRRKFHSEDSMRKNSLVRLALLLALAAVPAAPQRGTIAAKPVHIRTARELESAFARVDQIFSAEFAKDNLASATIGVVSGPNLVWTKSYGLADMEKKVAATRDSAY